jgi:Lon protease-like protein
MGGHLKLFPLNTVLFPGSALNLHIFEPRYRQMIAECLEDGEVFGVCLIREGDEAGDLEVTPHDVGTTAEISAMRPLDGGRFFLSTVGRKRFRIERILARDPYLLAEVEYLDDEPVSGGATVDALLARITKVFAEYLRLVVAFSGTSAEVTLPDDAVEASYLIGGALQIADTMKQRLLELPTTEERLVVELEFLRRLLPQLRALLERKRDAPPAERANRPTGTVRAAQEKYFGKHFSLN